MVSVLRAVSEASVDRIDETSVLEYGFDASPLSCGAASPYSFHGDAAGAYGGGFGLGTGGFGAGPPQKFCSDSLGTNVPRKLTAGPWLLGKEAGPSPMVTVKNTFINGYVQEEQEDECTLPMLAAKSCPVVKMPIPQADAAAERSPCFGAAVFANFGQDEPRSLTVQYLDGDNSSADGSPAYILPRELAESLRADSIRASSSPTAPAFFTATDSMRTATSPMAPSFYMSSDALGSASTTASTNASMNAATQELGVVKPFEIREPEVSFGSGMHGTGECRPCAWFWRPQGCTNGSECRHCHLCPQGEVKARRKSKISSMRQQGQMDRTKSSELPLSTCVANRLPAQAPVDRAVSAEKLARAGRRQSVHIAADLQPVAGRRQLELTALV